VRDTEKDPASLEHPSLSASSLPLSSVIMPPVALETNCTFPDGLDSVPPAAAVTKKPNAYNDATEAWRRNIREDGTFVTDSHGNRPDWFWTGKGPDSGCPGMREDGTISHLPLPNLSHCSRQEAMDYFDNIWTVTEVLFSSLQGCAGFRVHPGRIQALYFIQLILVLTPPGSLCTPKASHVELVSLVRQERRSSTAHLTTISATHSSSTTAIQQPCM